LILFGDQAYLQTPLTFDRKTLWQMLKESELGIAGERTAIGNAIGLAVKRMKDLPDTEKVLVLLTDGQNTAGDVSPEDAGLMAKETGMRIHTIGVGADEAWVRTFFGKQKINPSAELDEAMLQELSNSTGGSYFRARSTEELEKIYALIDEIEPIEKEKEVYRPRKALFIWPLGFVVLILGMWLATFMLLNKSI
jgi:Ca-activated chloride channel family protein